MNPCMPDAAPYRLHISRHYGWSVPSHAPREGWAACTGRSPGSRLWRFPSAFPTSHEQLARYGISGIVGEARRLQLRGQPRHRIASNPHRVPYSPVAACAPRGTVTPSLSPVGACLVKSRLQVVQISVAPCCASACQTNSGWTSGRNANRAMSITVPVSAPKPRTFNSIPSAENRNRL
jgi:hypothetical protein